MRFLWRPYNRKPARADPFDPGQIKHDDILRARGLADAANATFPGRLLLLLLLLLSKGIGNIYRRAQWTAITICLHASAAQTRIVDSNRFARSPSKLGLVRSRLAPPPVPIETKRFVPSPFQSHTRFSWPVVSLSSNRRKVLSFSCSIFFSIIFEFVLPKTFKHRMLKFWIQTRYSVTRRAAIAFIRFPTWSPDFFSNVIFYLLVFVIDNFLIIYTLPKETQFSNVIYSLLESISSGN